MKISELPDVEKRAIEILVEGNQELSQQLELVNNVSRVETGAGVYVNFELGPEARRVPGEGNFNLADVFATSASCEEIGFILSVREGLIEYLEAYVYSDRYPSYSSCNYVVNRQVVKNIESRR